MKILVIDDEAAMITMFRLAFRERHVVEGAIDMEEGAKLAAAGEYDFIVLDYVMKSHNGAWFMQNTALPSTTKVLLLTGRDDPATIAKMVELGVCGYFIKPVSVQEMVRYMESHAGDAGRRETKKLTAAL
jgi:DNA-binding response OmpR family regulator